MLDGVICSGGRIQYLPSPIIMKSGAVREPLFFDYGSAVDVSALPEHIKWVPAIYNLAPLIFATGLSAVVPFRYEPMERGLEAIRNEFRRLYPSIGWHGSVTFEGQPVPNPTNLGRTVAMYSGGLDSVHTIFRRYATSPTLVMLERTTTGAGSKQRIRNRAAAFADGLGLELVMVETNATTFFDGPRLGSFAALRALKTSWWGGVQYGCAIGGAASPVAYSRGAEVVYIASSHSESYTAPGGSSPEIDRNICWPGCRVSHDSFDRSRQQKVAAMIVENPRPQTKPQLVVCNKPLAGVANCGWCEKCLRTMAGLMVEGEDPRDWGFDDVAGPDEAIARMRTAFRKRWVRIGTDHVLIWKELAERARATGKCPQLSDWIESIDLESHRRLWDRREATTAFLRTALPRPLLNAARAANNWLLTRRLT